MDNLQLYMTEIQNYPLLTKEQEVELGKRISQGDKTALETLVLSNLRLVVSIVSKSYTPNTSLSFLDLIQEGNIGLIRAAKKYDYTKGCKFSTLATWWIKQAISNAINNNSRLIRLPQYAILELARINKIKANLSASGKEATIEILSKETGLPEERVKLLTSLDNPILSLDFQYDNKEDVGEFYEVIADTDPTPDSLNSKANLKQSIINIVRTLPEKEEMSILLRFGLYDGKEHTFEQIGEFLGVTRETARQIEMSALLKLQSSKYKKVLKELSCD